jgi:hypothetical protein
VAQTHRRPGKDHIHRNARLGPHRSAAMTLGMTMPSRPLVANSAAPHRSAAMTLGMTMPSRPLVANSAALELASAVVTISELQADKMSFHPEHYGNASGGAKASHTRKDRLNQGAAQQTISVSSSTPVQ